MFRDMRRKKRQVGSDACFEVLAGKHRAVLAMNGDNGYPYCIPVDFLFEDGHIYIHGAKAGYKFDCLSADDRVCFTVHDDGVYEEGDWAPYVTSVVVFGHAHLVQDPEFTAQQTRKLGLKYYPNPDEVEDEMREIAAVQLIDLEIEHMTGKRIHEK